MFIEIKDVNTKAVVFLLELKYYRFVIAKDSIPEYKRNLFKIIQEMFSELNQL